MAYSLDICERVMAAVERGDRSQSEIAEDFSVSRGFIQKLIKRKAERGTLRPQKPTGPRPALSRHDDAIRAALEGNADLRLTDLAERFRNKKGKAVNKGTVSRHLKRLDITFKKNKSMRASGTANAFKPSAKNTIRAGKRGRLRN